MKNNRNKFFSISLYKDALKQLRIIGIVLAVVMGYMPIATGMMVGDHLFFTDKIDCILYLFTTSVVMIYIFRFTTKRKASDVFCSLPYTRTCLYISYVLAAFTWIIAIMVINVMGRLVYYKRYKYMGHFTIRYNLGMLACVILIMGGISIAQGLTGTIFTNIAMSGVILFVPRLLIRYIVGFIYDLCPYANMNYVKLPFRDNINILSLIVGFDDSYLDITNTGVIYAFVLGIIYLIIGGILFNRRKSETAGHAASNKWIQGVVRTLITLVICLIPLYNIIMYYLDYNDRTIDILYIVILYGLAILVYFLFELLATRKVRNLLRAIPGILVVILCNVAIFICVYGATENIKKFRPDVDEVEYITVSTDFGYDRDMSIYINDKDYVLSISKNVKIKEENIIQMLTNQYNKYVDKPSQYQYSVWNSSYIYYNKVDVDFCVDGKLYHRTVQLSDMMEESILEYLYKQPEVIDKVLDIPEVKDIIRIKPEENYTINANISDEDAVLLYESYKKELQGMRADLKSVMGDNDYLCKLVIDYRGKKGNTWSYIKIVSSMPETYKLFLSIAGKNQEQYLDNLEININNSLQLDITFSIGVLSDGKFEDDIYIDSDILFNIEYPDEQLKECVKEFIKEAETSHKIPDNNEKVYVMSIGEKTLVFSADEKCAELFNKMVKLNR